MIEELLIEHFMGRDRTSIGFRHITIREGYAYMVVKLSQETGQVIDHYPIVVDRIEGEDIFVLEIHKDGVTEERFSLDELDDSWHIIPETIKNVIHYATKS